MVCTAFIEKLNGACMRGARAGADAPLLGGFKWLPWGATICNTFKQVGGSVTSVSKPYGA